MANCTHNFVVGPDGQGLYARCLKCKGVFHVQTFKLLVELGAVRVENEQYHFTVDPEVEHLLKVKI